MASIRDVATLAGVSTSTVSRALNNDPAVNGLTREKVMAAANNSGYVAAVGRRVTTNIGLVYAGGQTLESTYDAALLGGVVRGLAEPKFDVVVVNLHRDKTPDETYSQFFRRKGLRGILLRTTTPTHDLCSVIAEEGFPMIVLSERFEDPRVSFIDCDSERESARAVEYLIALGHRRIAFGMNIVADTDHADRLAGYRQALTEHGIPFDEKLILKQKADFAGGASAIQILMAMRQPPTAVYFADPALAVGAINGAHQAGIRIPEDVSIVGFDDAELRHSVHPVMTAVCQNAADLGFDAAQELTQMILRQTGEPVRKILTTFFEINQSTAPPPDQPVRVIAGKEPE